MDMLVNVTMEMVPNKAVWGERNHQSEPKFNLNPNFFTFE